MASISIHFKQCLFLALDGASKRTIAARKKNKLAKVGLGQCYLNHIKASGVLQ